MTPDNRDALTARSISLLVAAASTVVPHADATTMSTAKSGFHATSQPSLKVPEPLTSSGTPQSIDKAASRCSRTDFARSGGLRKSNTSSRTMGSILSRAERATARRSASRGTVGASVGVDPNCSPITSSSVISRITVSSPSHITASVASLTSASPGSGRRRSVDRLSASRAASMMCADEIAMSLARNRCATLISHRVITS